jgi:hypothetical protein
LTTVISGMMALKATNASTGSTMNQALLFQVLSIGYALISTRQEPA